MRIARWARWATCALAVSICVPAIPALADRARRSVATCASFDQSDEHEARVAFTIHNTCSMPLECAVSWRVVCAPESKHRRSAHPAATSLAISNGTSERTEASAAVCGDDGWVIDSVRWSCQADNH